MNHATLINPFEVPAGNEDQFFEHWKEAADYMRQREGFISTQLHQSFDPEAAFRFLTSRCGVGRAFPAGHRHTRVPRVGPEHALL